MADSVKRLLSLLIFGLLSSAWTRTVAQTVPTADEIVQHMLAKNAERQAALERYSSQRTYRVEYKGTGGRHAAEIVVHAEFTVPNQKQFTLVSQSGSKLICEKVLWKLVESEREATTESNRAQTTLSPTNYNIQLAGEEEVNDVKAWVLQVSPKVDNKFTYRGRVWVSEDGYAVMRVLGEPAKNPSWWINHASFDSRYVRRGEFWLPGHNVSTSHVRVGGDAVLTIDYGGYETVVGRADSGEETLASLAR